MYIKTYIQIYIYIHIHIYIVTCMYNTYIHIYTIIRIYTYMHIYREREALLALLLTYADVCWRMLTDADGCWRMLTDAGWEGLLAHPWLGWWGVCVCVCVCDAGGSTEGSFTALLLLYYCFTDALLQVCVRCGAEGSFNGFTTALLLLYYCFTTGVCAMRVAGQRGWLISRRVSSH